MMRVAGSERLVGLTSVDALPILLVDDRAEDLRTLEAILAPLGYPLHSASSAREALRLLLANDYALILLDVRMPGPDGRPTAELIKSRARTRDVPIVFLAACRDEVGEVIHGYGLGAIDYVLKPFDAELLRSKVAVFAELEANRRALKRSESFLRGAFEAAPIGKTVLDGARRIVRSNPAFARLIGRDRDSLAETSVEALCHREDRAGLSATLDRVARGDAQHRAPESAGVDLRLIRASGAEVWVGLVASSIEPTDFGESLLLAQWVDLSARRRAERARGELLVEQAARGQAEALAERLRKLEELTSGLEPLGLDDLLRSLANRLVAMFDAAAADLQVSGELDEPVRIRASGGRAERVRADHASAPPERSHEQPLRIEDVQLGVVRLEFSGPRSLTTREYSLVQDAAERIALSIRRAQLHGEEHRVAALLQRGLLPKRLPTVAGVEVAARYEAAGVGAEVGGDWYDAFVLPGGRLGIVVGDVAGRSIPAASAMGQLRTVTRTLALGDEGYREPGEALTRLNRYQLATGDDELFTVVYAILDPGEQAIAWAAAGHPPPLIRTEGGRTRYLEAGGGVTGLSDTEYHTFHGKVGPGDVLVLYTDGLVERRGESLDAGLERLAAAVATGPADPGELATHVLAKLLAQDESLHDDVTALVARIS